MDYENNAEAWWDAAWDATRAAPARSMGEAAIGLLLVLLERLDEVVVEDEEAAEIRAWASALLGWADGPEHARHPLLFQEVEGS